MSRWVSLFSLFLLLLQQKVTVFYLGSCFIFNGQQSKPTKFLQPCKVRWSIMFQASGYNLITSKIKNAFPFPMYCTILHNCLVALWFPLSPFSSELSGIWHGQSKDIRLGTAMVWCGLTISLQIFISFIPGIIPIWELHPVLVRGGLPQIGLFISNV